MVDPRLDAEAAKGPAHRRAFKRFPLGIAIAVAIAYFGIRFASGTPVVDPILTRPGLTQRAAATKKLLRYDRWMNVHGIRGGRLKGILFWPIEPTNEEVRTAGEFFGLTLGTQRAAAAKFGCANLHIGERSHLVEGSDLSNEEVRFAGLMAEYVQDDRTDWDGPPIAVILRGAIANGGCQQG